MKKMMGFSMVLLLVCLFLGGPVHAEIAENKGLFHQNIKLFTGDSKDSYLLLIPIQVTQPGRVEFEFKLLKPDEERYLRVVEKARPEKEPVFRWSFVDSRFLDKKKPMEPGKFQQWVNEFNNYNPAEYLAGDEIRAWVKSMKATMDYIFGKGKGRKAKEVPVYLHGTSNSVRFPHTPENHISSGRMRHDIDFTELSQTQGMYFLVLENFTQLTPELEVKVSFPGTQYQVDKAFLLQRDLGITSLNVKVENIHVEVQNLGEGKLTEDLYARKGKDALNLMLYLNGRSWGGVTLAGLDPGRKLAEPGGKVGYTFNLKVPENARVTAKLAMPEFADSNSANNERQSALSVPVMVKPILQR